MHPLREQNPIETIKFRMEQMGLSKADLAKQAFNGHRGRVGEIISGKRKLTLPMIRKLSEVLRVDPKYLIADYGN
ncbi:MAG: helix-turn-helix domain-containing protein [Bacteroidota bacterium]